MKLYRKSKSFKLLTRESRQLFHISIRVDKLIRKILQNTKKGIISPVAYSHTHSNWEEIIREYNIFLGNLFTRFDEWKHTEDFLHIPFFVDLSKKRKVIFADSLKEIKNMGVTHKALINTEIGEEFFSITERMDLCLKILENFCTINRKSVLIHFEIQTALNTLNEKAYQQEQLDKRKIKNSKRNYKKLTTKQKS